MEPNPQCPELGDPVFDVIERVEKEVELPMPSESERIFIALPTLNPAEAPMEKKPLLFAFFSRMNQGFQLRFTLTSRGRTSLAFVTSREDGPALKTKCSRKNNLAECERGHKARGYEPTEADS